MTDESPLGERSEKCEAEVKGKYATCSRCGQEWSIDVKAPPPCLPMSYERMRLRLLDEISSAGASLKIVEDLRDEGKPANSGPARRRVAELKAIYRLYLRVIDDPQIFDRLQGKGKKS